MGNGNVVLEIYKVKGGKHDIFETYHVNDYEEIKHSIFNIYIFFNF